MKKLGFTLAEVLITLAIVGFIASITLPSLNASTNERQHITALKKSINTLTNAAMFASMEDGRDFSSISNRKEIRAILNLGANVNTDAPAKIAGSNNAIFFRDGTALLYGDDKDITTTEKTNGISVTIDTNGEKGPNRVSTCQATDCSGQRSINDRYSVLLKGTMVIPNDAPSRWAMSR